MKLLEVVMPVFKLLRAHVVVLPVRTVRLYDLKKLCENHMGSSLFQTSLASERVLGTSSLFLISSSTASTPTLALTRNSLL